MEFPEYNAVSNCSESAVKVSEMFCEENLVFTKSNQHHGTNNLHLLYLFTKHCLLFSDDYYDQTT